MDDQRFEVVAELFEAARNLPPADRRAWLDEACDDENLRGEVLSLLREHEAESLELDPTTRAEALRRWIGASLSPGPDDGEWQPPAFEIPGFRILSLLGEGGMGSVYEAEQDRPQRTVALKVLRPHVGGSGVRRRFEQEADILARLQHPGIATVHEVGVVETEMGSLPYFAMELVRGKTLSKHAASLSRNDKLELVARVADAVGYAHHHGVIHRDLKPSNILVDDHGMPRVLDFGIARVTDSDVQATRQTDVGQVIGTLAYMSPEQAAGRPEDIDERSDVFSLGVIAFELMCGCLPREVSGLPFPEALRVLMESETTTLRHFDRSLAGDIETIVTKALANEKERRYTSIAEFADDLRRFLRSEPIRARRATALYHMGRFIRRHRLVSALLIALFIVLIVGTVTSTSLFFEARAKAEELNTSNYMSTLENVSTSLRYGEGRDIAALLASCAPELRGWEWDWLSARLDTSQQSFEPPSSAGISGNGFVWASAVDAKSGRIITATAPAGSLGRRDYKWMHWSRDGELLGSVEARTRVMDMAFSQEGDVFGTTGFDMAADPRPPESAIWAVDAEEPLARTAMGGFFIAPWPEEEGLWAIGNDRGVFLWDTTGPDEPVPVLETQLGALALTSDRRLISVDVRGSVKTWETDVLLEAAFEEGQPPFEHELDLSIFAAVSPPVALAVADVTDHLAIGFADGAIVLSSPGLENPRVVHLPYKGLEKLLFLDSRRLLCSDSSGTLHVYDAERGIALTTLPAHRTGVTSLTRISTGGEFLTTSLDRTIRTWNVDAVSSERILEGRTGAPNTNQYFMAFSPDGKRFAWHVAFETVQVIDIASGHVLFELDHERTDSMSTRVAFGADGERIYTSNIAGEVRVWDDAGKLLEARQTGSVLTCLDTASGMGAYMTEPPSQLLVEGRLDPVETPSKISVHDLATWEARSSFDCPAVLNHMHFSRDGTRLVGGTYGGKVIFVDPHRGQVLWQYQIPDVSPGDSAHAMTAISAEGRHIAFTLFDQSNPRLFICEPEKNPEPRLLMDTVAVTSVTFHPQSTRLVVGTWNGSLHVLDPELGPIVNLGGPVDLGRTKPVAKLIFSPDGSTLATANSNRVHRLLHTR